MLIFLVKNRNEIIAFDDTVVIAKIKTGVLVGFLLYQLYEHVYLYYTGSEPVAVIVLLGVQCY